MKQPKKQRIEIDTGCTILTVDVTDSPKGPLVTAYVNGVSVRCGSLHLERIFDRFIDCTMRAADLTEHDEGYRSVQDELELFVQEVAQ
jgi:hypothetical protein